MAEAKHAILLVNGSKEIYAEDISFNETSAAKIRQTIGADFTERSKVTPKGTLDFGVVVPATAAVQYRTLLRRGTELDLTWVGADGVKHQIRGIVQSCNESDPKEGEHRMSVTIEGLILSPR